MGNPAFSVRLDNSEEIACLFVTGELDLATAHHLAASVSVALTAGDHAGLIIDLSQTTFCDSAGLQVLVGAERACRERGTGLVLRGADDRFRNIIKVAGLGGHFAIEP